MSPAAEAGVVRAVVEVLARALTDRPDDVTVIESQHRGTTLVELYVAPGELGRVIGRQGRTAAALRTLAATAGEREGKTVTLEIRDTPYGVMLANWDEMALVGRIARAHGIRGQVIVNPETDFPEERFQPGAELFVNRAGVVEPVLVTTVRFHRERPVIGLRGFDDMNAASGLAGSELRVPVACLAPLPPGAFYRHDLVGCRVETREGGQIGIVTDVEGTMGGSRLVVDAPSGEVLVPFVVAICTTIDPAGKRIVIDPPDGLLEVNAGRSG